VRLSGAARARPFGFMDLVVARPEGLYCTAGDFYIDPWKPVARAVITHAHSDHARVGHGHYLAHTHSEGTLRTRLGEITLQTLPYGETIEHNGVKISLHPAGHVLGSAQVRMEHGGRVWVASGDYKLEADGTCPPFEPVRCDTFITESTFGLPIYRWATPAALALEINDWWRSNADAGRASVIFCYAFGKAQRILYGADPSIGAIVVHGAVEPLNAVYCAAGVALPPTLRVSDDGVNPQLLKRALVLAPPSAQGTPWMKRFGNYSDAFASGWMQLRGTRRRRGVDRGFVTHGSVAIMVRWLTDNGLEAQSFKTEYGDDDEADKPDSPVKWLAEGGPASSEQAGHDALQDAKGASDS
jgi:putative mRNA 3-end processing factor